MSWWHVDTEGKRIYLDGDYVGSVRTREVARQLAEELNVTEIQKECPWGAYCVEERCALWNPKDKRCIFYTLEKIVAALDYLGDWFKVEAK